MSENYIDKWNANGQQYDIQDAGRGLPLGVATLDNNGRIPYEQLPESAVEFKGYWNASTNTPHLADGTGTKGDMYYTDVAGSQDLGSGTQYFNVGDRVLYDGSVWKNINSTAVKSVNGVLPNAQGDVNILNKVYPVGSIYQNMTDPTNPAVLFGIGTWAQINDAFLACASANSYSDVAPKYNGATTGGGTYTLTEANIPQHSHAQQGTFSTASQSSTTTSTESANHTHNFTTAFTVQDNTGGGAAYRTTYAPDGAFVGVEASHNSAYTIIVGAAADSNVIRSFQTTGTTTIDSADHTHQFEHTHGITIGGNTGTYGYASPTAISIIPTYQAVYTWYRTA